LIEKEAAMCEFCLQHGEGQKWYLQAKNYSEDLLSDARRRKFIAEFFSRSAEERGQSVRGMDASLDQFNRLPGFARSMAGRWMGSKAKKEHHGQVLPIEDVEQILGFVNSVVRVACVCRMGIYGPEPRFCYGVSMAPPEVGPFAFLRDDPSYRGGPALENMETLTKEEALAAFRHHEEEGLCHTVWTFVTPFIGGVCNCDRQDCQAVRATAVHRLPYLYRSEYVAAVNHDVCTGCRTCMRACQFGAISYSPSLDKTVIEPRLCYGCGTCRAHCARGAISLSDRRSVPAVANLW
jgi:ferredoxin